MRSAVIKIFFIIFLAAHTSCHRQQGERIAQNNPKDVVSTVPASNTENRIAQKQDTISKAEEFTDELEGNDELVNISDFRVWEGNYAYSFDYTDNAANDYILKAFLRLNKPDYCVLETWYEKPNGKKKYNYVKIVGSILKADTKDNLKIEFYEGKTLIGNSPNLSPILTLYRENNGDYFIESFLTSPPHNGIVKMPIQRIEK